MLEIIETISKENVIIFPIGNQSFKALHECSCYFIQHGFTGNRFKTLSEENKIDRAFFVELCNKHK